MIGADYLLSLLGFSLAMSGTPGPNNMMVMASGLTFGFRRTLPHLLGIGIGFGFMLLLVGLGLGQVFAAYPLLFSAMKIAGALYLMWMAWVIARSGPVVQGPQDARSQPFSFWQAAGFQWVNPKAWVVAIGAVSTYAQPQSPVTGAVFLSLVMGVMGLLCAIVWTGFGTVLRQVLQTPRAVRFFNLAMALLLVASLWPIVSEGIRLG